ncbi:acyl-CoA reductase [Sphingobacterium sp. DK4209]|uniref:Acyl-CoA reductase n=1 Tax=Sphingobacterium zhuxiongii TaxID=2662364 RepID=A0A5Q0QAY6_9SPHI|nr:MULTISPECIES: acyl-CoA reductase [unclassified Sphingobacterium]MVZ66978.1 acyl-CoA reductase [Sphingobacterium sp. DK4209]QGA26606.1 acyl-CoA reductase [Sphingobacterium sp. dk4302]
MIQEQRIQAFSKLGTFLSSNDESIQSILELAERRNPWYSKSFVQQQFLAFGKQLNQENLTKWLANSPDTESEKVVGLVLAGNLPLVGFHDILSVLISGFKAQIKTSSDDAGLTQFVLDKLVEIEPAFAARFTIVDILRDYDLVIATGSNNSARYFEHYFGKKPHIIRKNRNSIAVLNGEETNEQLMKLGHDIFDFYGLGCRSVSKIYIPEDYDIARFFESIESFNWIQNHHKYNNNYDFNKSIYLINKNQHYDNGFLLLKEDESMTSPLAVVHYERYRDIFVVEAYLNRQSENIQCVSSEIALAIESPVFPMGSSQAPALDDYADQVNTLEFLKANQ